MKWLLLLALIIPSVAQAHQMRCAPYADLSGTLIEVFRERKTHIGIAEDIRGSTLLVEIWQNRDKSSFTILIVHPNGLACLGTTGKSLEFLKDTWNEQTQR